MFLQNSYISGQSCLETARDLTNILAYYRFDNIDPLDNDADTDVEAVSDLSGNGNNLVSFLPNAGFQPQRDTTNFVSTDGSVLFAGTSSRFLASTANPDGDTVAQFDGTASFSISAWVRRASIGTNDVVASRHSTTTNLNWRMIFLTSGGERLEFRVGRADGGSPGSTGTGLSAQTLQGSTMNTWHHCVATFDATTGTIRVVMDADFANSSFTTDAAFIGNLFTSADVPLRIGQGRSDPFHGNIDEFIIYTKLLSDCEIQALFDLGTVNGALIP